MTENPLIALRRKRKAAEASKENPLIAARTKAIPVSDRSGKKAEVAQAQPIGGTDPDAMRYKLLEQEFNKMSSLGQLGQSADDLARLFASGVSYGSLDEALGEQSKTEDARLRAGIPGMIAQGGGMLASPVTRTVGAVAKPLYTSARGALPMLRNLLAAGSEGAALSGTESAIRGGDIVEDAEKGAALSAGASGLLKYVLPTAGKLLGSTMSSVPKQTYEDAFELGAKSKEANAAINAVRKGEAPVAMLDKITTLRKSLANIPVKNRQAVEEALLKIQDEIRTSGGFNALDNVDAGHINRLIDNAYTEIQALGSGTGIRQFNRNSLDDLAAYLENTKMPAKAAISASGRYAKDVHDTVKKVAGKQDPRFTELVEATDDLAKARSVGTQTKNWRPEKSGIGTFLQAGSIAGSPLLHLAGMASPLVSTGLAGAGLASWLAASPRLTGKMAQTLGVSKRQLKKLLESTTGAKASYGKLGVAPAIEEKY